MITKFAYRNLLRNKKRTLISALSVFVAGLLVGVAYGWVNGMMDNMLESFIKYQTAHVRITTEEYENRQKFLPVDEIIYESETYIDHFKKIKGVKNIEQRIRFGILLGKEETTLQAVGMGLDINNNSFHLKEKIIDGKTEDHGIYIGHKLASKLKIKIGDELLLATKTSMGGLNGIKLKVAAIFKMNMTSLDSRFFFININDAKRLLKISEGITEIYIFADDEKMSDSISDQIKPLLGAGIVSRTYKEQMGAMYAFIGIGKMIYFIIEMAILFLACFVIINTMTMAIFERMREIGTMKALGFSEKELFWTFTTEGAFIGMAGGLPGALIGFGFIFVLSITGVNLEGMLSSIDMPMEYIIYPKLTVIDIFAVISMACVVPVMASMIPARYIRRYLPSDALRM